MARSSTGLPAGGVAPARGAPLRRVACLLVFASLASSPGWGRPPEIADSVVRIVNHAQTGDWYSPWNVSVAREETGSGFVIPGGRVMTNAHVVSDSRLCVFYLHNDPTPHPARVAMIGHDCDLALLEPVEPGLLAGVPTLAFGDLPELRSTVETYGYPAGGRRLSSTRGVVSRVELQPFVHSGLDAHLTVQTDAAINPGNSGGPVIQDGAVVGVAFQGTAQLENVGFFIPTEVIAHFLADAADGRYEGYPELGVQTANLENPAAREAAGMADGEEGVTVFFVFPGSSADGHLWAGDVLLEAQGHRIANDGTVAVDGLRFEFGVLADRLQAGDALELTVLRSGERLRLSVPLRPYPVHQRFANTYDRLPRYFVYGGLVFVPLDREVLKTFGPRWQTAADRVLLHEFFYRFFAEPQRLLREPVILLRCLDHPVNANLAWRRNQLLETVNGLPADSLQAVIAAIEGNTAPEHVFAFGQGGRLEALDRAEGDRANGEILSLYGVQKDRRP